MKSLLIVMTLLGLAIATTLPQPGFAQSDPEAGVWQLNVSKSQFSPYPPPKSLTLTFQRERENRTVTLVGITAAGAPLMFVFANGVLPGPTASPLHFLSIVEDGQPHSVTGSPFYDAIAVTRVDAYSTYASYTKAGKLVQIATTMVSRDGKMMVMTAAGTYGQQFNNIGVYDKQ
jgi:hypothetical protein